MVGTAVICRTHEPGKKTGLPVECFPQLRDGLETLQGGVHVTCVAEVVQSGGKQQLEKHKEVDTVG